MAENESQGISRRDLLKRGAALGGAVVWATPVVQTLGMGRAFANTASPVDDGPDISYIALIVACGGSKYYVKWESDTGWEKDPGATPGCMLTVGSAEPKFGPDLGLTMTEDPSNPGCYILGKTGESTCTSVDVYVVKGGQECPPEATGAAIPFGPICL